MSHGDGDYVVLRVHGGLGNQLFQYAAGLGLADRLGVRLVLHPTTDVTALERCIGPQPRATPRELLRVNGLRTSRPARLASFVQRHAWLAPRERLGVPPRRVAAPDAYRFDERLDRLVAPCYVTGHFQHLGHVEPALAEVCDRMISQLDLRTAADRVHADRSGDAPVVGVSLRRGDYVPLGWALDPTYTSGALDRVEAILGERPRVSVFADDRLVAELMAERLAAAGYSACVGSRPDRDMLADLVGLVSCPHLVLANSTYAWWAAAIGDRLHPGAARVVACPEPWVPDHDARLRRAAWEPVPATFESW